MDMKPAALVAAMMIFASGIFGLYFVSCSDGEEKLNSQIQELRHRKSSLIGEIDGLKREKALYQREVDLLKDRVKDLEAESEVIAFLDDEVPMLELEIRQSTFTLNLSEHAKNSINAMRFWIGVDHELYSRVRIGDDIADAKFKAGSFLLDGDLSKLSVKVVNKRLVRRP